MITLELATQELINKVDNEIDGTIKDDNMINIAIKRDGQSLGIFQAQYISNACISLHMHILSEYQNKGYALQCLKPLLELLKTTNIKAILATIPMNNKIMMGIMQKTPFKCCGSIPNSIIYKQQLQDMVLFSLEVK